MENSVLSDAAGVQKNISKMYEEYAQKISKSTDTLTQAEKAQAVYNGIMAEAGMYTGSAAEMAEGYQGQQAQLNAINLELSRTIGEAMLPTLTQYSSLQLSITKGLVEFSKEHKGATSGVITFTTALLATVAAMIAVKKAVTSYTTATGVANTVTKAFTASLMANPLFLGGLALSVGISALTVFNTKMQESIDKMNEATESSNNLVEALNNFAKKGEFTDVEKSTVEKERDEAQKEIDIYEERNEKIKQLEEERNKLIEKYNKSEISTLEYEAQLRSLNQIIESGTEAQKEQEKTLSEQGKTIDSLKRKVSQLNDNLSQSDAKQEYLTLTNTKANREQLVSIAQTKAEIDGKKQLLNILKQGKTGTEQYTDAKNKLVKVYPELANVNENTIANTEALINAEERAAQSEWDLAQSTIQNSITELEAMKANDEKVQEIAVATRQKVEDVRASIEAATNSLRSMLNLTMPDLAGVVDTSNFAPKTTKSSGGSKSYSNKALDNYKSLIEYKKSLDKISLEEEIKMYKTALEKYAKTTDEKRELTTKIYELEKELQEENLSNYTAKVEHKKALDKISLEKEIESYEYAYKKLAKTTEQKRELEEKLYELKKELAQKEKQLLSEQLEDYEEYMKEKKKLQGAAYDIVEQQQDYDALIQMHTKYIDEILSDERLSIEERKELYNEELETIKGYEEQKRNLRVEQIDNTVSQLASAITKQLEEMEEADKKAIESNIELVEKWKDTRINAINEEYNTRIEAIQKELDLLDDSEEEKTRLEEDAEYKRKRNRLQELIDYEHDATTKANYQKELDKLISDYQKTLDKRTLQDKKDALKEQQDLLKEEQDSKVEAIESEAEKQKTQYETQIDELEKYYKTQQDKAQETAEKMLLNADDNQKKILDLLKNYGDAYEITGQSLGEKLAQGINTGIVGQIEGVIKKIQNTIDSGIGNKIASWTSSIDDAQSKTKQSQTSSKNITVNQNNYIEQNPEMPSETYRKLRDIEKALADQLAGA